MFTDTERGVLVGYRTARKTGNVMTLSTTRGDAYQPTGYVPDGTRYGFPWYAADVTDPAGGW